MAEKLSLELELLDKVGGPAKRAAAALRGIEVQQKRTQDAISKFADSWRRIGTTATSARDKEAAAFRKMGLAQLEALKMNKQYDDQIKKAASNHGGFLASFKHALPFRSIGDYFKGAFWGHLAADGVEKIAEGFVEGAHKAVELIYDGVKEAFGAIAREQQRVAGYNLTLGKPESKEAREAIEKWSPKTAFSASQNMDQMLPLFRAGLTGKAATTAYASALDLAAGRGQGANPEAVSEAVALFAKIQQKGGITTKQLAGVGLGEKNVPAFFKDLGKQLHMSAEAAEKLAKKPGGIDPQVLSNAITDAINKMQGGKAGTGAEVAGKSLAGQWNKLKAMPEEFFNKLAESPALERMSEALGNVLKQLDPNSPTGKKIFAALEKSFNGLLDWITSALSPDHIEAFGRGVERVVGFIEKIPEYLNDAVKVAEVLAAIFVGKKLVEAITGAITGISVASAPLIAAAAAAVALYETIVSINKAVSELGGAKAVGRDLVDFATSGGGTFYAAAGENAGHAAAEAENQRNLNRAREKAIRQSISMVNNSIINVDAAGDPTHTGQKAGVAIASGMTKEMERARAEAGAQ